MFPFRLTKLFILAYWSSACEAPLKRNIPLPNTSNFFSASSPSRLKPCQHFACLTFLSIKAHCSAAASKASFPWREATILLFPRVWILIWYCPHIRHADRCLAGCNPWLSLSYRMLEGIKENHLITFFPPDHCLAFNLNVGICTNCRTLLCHMKSPTASFLSLLISLFWSERCRFITFAWIWIYHLMPKTIAHCWLMLCTWQGY